MPRLSGHVTPSFLHGYPPQAAVLGNSQHCIDSTTQQQQVINKKRQTKTQRTTLRHTDLMETDLSSRELLSLIAVECVFMHVCVRPFRSLKKSASLHGDVSRTCK